MTESSTPTPKKNPHAQALSKLGAVKGGIARFANMTKEQRSEYARKMLKARWGEKKDDKTN
jgi:hypothetical protein